MEFGWLSVWSPCLLFPVCLFCGVGCAFFVCVSGGDGVIVEDDAVVEGC